MRIKYGYKGVVKLAPRGIRTRSFEGMGIYHDTLYMWRECINKIIDIYREEKAYNAPVMMTKAIPY